MPYKSSTKDFSLGLIDRDIVKRYRLWLMDHFINDFQYETNSILNLGRLNDSNSYKPNTIREFDLLVRIDKLKILQPSENPFATSVEESKIATPQRSSPFKAGEKLAEIIISDMTGP